MRVPVAQPARLPSGFALERLLVAVVVVVSIAQDTESGTAATPKPPLLNIRVASLPKNLRFSCSTANSKACESISVQFRRNESFHRTCMYASGMDNVRGMLVGVKTARKHAL